MIRSGMLGHVWTWFGHIRAEFGHVHLSEVGCQSRYSVRTAGKELQTWLNQGSEKPHSQSVRAQSVKLGSSPVTIPGVSTRSPSNQLPYTLYAPASSRPMQRRRRSEKRKNRSASAVKKVLSKPIGCFGRTEKGPLQREVSEE